MRRSTTLTCKVGMITLTQKKEKKRRTKTHTKKRLAYDVSMTSQLKFICLLETNQAFANFHLEY